MKYTTYIFDFDFTLADATPGIVTCVNYALKQLEWEPKDRDTIRKTVGMTLRETFRALTGSSDQEAAERFVSFFTVMADKVMTDNTSLFDDTAEVLKRLKRSNHGIAIVTSKLHYRIDEVLQKYKISNLIDCIVGFEDVAAAKPSPEGLLKAIARLGAAKPSVLYIGDSLIDANTAANASVDFAAVLTGTTTGREFLEWPHICIAEKLTELINCLL
jgi:phosphoglycolate phosphatase